jgi:hypothetical protein
MNRLFTAIALLGLSVLGSSCTCASSKGDCCKKEGAACCSKPAKACCGTSACKH